MDKETYRFMYPAGIASLSLVFFSEGIAMAVRDNDR